MTQKKTKLEKLDGKSMDIVEHDIKDASFKDNVVKNNALQTLKRYGIENVKRL